MERGWGTKEAYGGTIMIPAWILLGTRNGSTKAAKSGNGLQGGEFGISVESFANSSLWHRKHKPLHFSTLTFLVSHSQRKKKNPLSYSRSTLLAQAGHFNFNIDVLHVQILFFQFARIYSVRSFGIRKFKKEFSSITIEEPILFVKNLWSQVKTSTSYQLYC